MNTGAGPQTAAMLERLAKLTHQRSYGLPCATPSRQASAVAPAAPPATAPAQPPEPATKPGCISITGTVCVQKARVAVGNGRDPEALLTFTLATAQGLNVRVQHSMGRGFAAHLAAQHVAQRLALLSAVTLRCNGLTPKPSGIDDGTVLQAIGITHVDPHTPAPAALCAAAGPQD